MPKNLLALLFAGAAFGQTVRFDVATIKTSLPLAALRAAGRLPHDGMKVSPDRVEFESAQLSYLIRLAYRVENYQVSGPDFMDRQRFDIVALMPGGAGPEQIPEMLQALLAERFKLVVRKETKEQTVYALVVGKDGPKMKESEPGAESIDLPKGRGGRQIMYAVASPDGVRTYSMLNGVMVYEAQKISMPDLARMLEAYFDEPVIDRTELEGTYQVAMNVPHGPNAPRMVAATGEAAEPSGVSIFASVEKLGLRLEKTKAPIEHIFVEHLEKSPTEN